jgi:hypothetical protein
MCTSGFVKNLQVWSGGAIIRGCNAAMLQHSPARRSGAALLCE